MDPEKITLIHSLAGEAAIIKDHLDEILFRLRHDRDKIEDSEIYYKLRQVVAKCDNMSTTIEKDLE